MKINGFVLFIGFCFVLMLFLSSRYFRATSYSSVGITYAKGFKLSADKPSQIKAILVVSGQQVKKGDILIELTSYSLDLTIEKLNNQLKALDVELEEKSKVARAQTDLAKSEANIDIERINAEIIQEESELTLNQKLTQQAGGVQIKDSPVQKKIDALASQRNLLQSSMKIKVDEIQQRYKADELIIQSQIKLLQQELNLWMQEKNRLKKVAESDGVIEQIFVKEGEHVEAYASLLSINPIQPTTVVGYSIGQKMPPTVGTKVLITAQNNSGNKVEGKVIGYGSVVALPQILQRSTAATGFGREFFIEIPAQNYFANGEKVLIK